MGVVLVIGLCLTPAGCFLVMGKAIDAMASWSGRPEWLRRRPTRQPLESEVDGLARDLRRLAADHDRLMNSEHPAQALRMRAIQLAYDDTLRHACKALDIDTPPETLDGARRIQVEADLAVRGLTW